MKNAKAVLLALFCLVTMLLCGCAGSSADESGGGTEPAETTVQAPAEQGLEGDWEDTVSQRAGMVITEEDDGTYHVRISWGASAFESAVWEFSGIFDADSGVLEYTDCVKKEVFWEDDGSVGSENILFSGGSGSIVLKDGMISWKDDTDDEGSECLFEKLD